MHPVKTQFFGQNGILCLFSNAGTLLSGWVHKQIGSKRYIVTDGVVTKVCTLVSTTSEATALPDGFCTFVVTPSSGDEYVSYLASTRCSTTADNGHAWRFGSTTSSETHLVNNIQYYNFEQGFPHAAPISGETYAASFTMRETGKLRIRLPLIFGESEGINTNFTVQLVNDNHTAPNLSSVLASQIFDDTVLGESRIFIEFTNAKSVTLTPGRYWVALTDGPNTSTGCCWFWETNVVDETVKNEFNYYTDPPPAAVLSNIDSSQGWQMSIEII